MWKACVSPDALADPVIFNQYNTIFPLQHFLALQGKIWIWTWSCIRRQRGEAPYAKIARLAAQIYLKGTLTRISPGPKVLANLFSFPAVLAIVLGKNTPFLLDFFVSFCIPALASFLHINGWSKMGGLTTTGTSYYFLYYCPAVAWLFLSFFEAVQLPMLQMQTRTTYARPMQNFGMRCDKKSKPMTTFKWMSQLIARSRVIQVRTTPRTK